MKKANITVIGSLNMDIVTKTSTIPNVGETVLGDSFFTIPGGKGANQAVAAARLGGHVNMVGRVGSDAFGSQLKDELHKQGVNLDNVKPVTHLSTGVATITLSNGDNSIIVVPGANYEVTPEVVLQVEEEIATSDILLLQLEIPLDSVIEAVRVAKKHHVPVILNPAPFLLLPKEVLQEVDYLTPNEHELNLLISSYEWSDDELDQLRGKCIVTKGERGISFFEGNEQLIPSYKVDVVDTTGAGDSVNGALAVAISNGLSLKEACRFANAVGALTVTKLGAQSGMPTKSEVESFLSERGEV
ncbi:ribokinase [Metabacillus crassostreae]|uniref:ribokinase n=1 Tax=Metabacillus crassostreae TaxID=929098 RepID=UPI0019597724|nr:ribokinase [Metabacillus crassostreae]MBM7606226.1 ribokinase [Metabacillus crassostreae]